MYLLIYSIDQDYNYTHESFDYRDQQEGNKEFLFVESLDDMSSKLFKHIKETTDNDTLHECIESEYIKITVGTYPLYKYYITIHEYCKIDNKFSFSISDTEEYKLHVEELYRENKDYQERKKKEAEKQLIEEELKELKRLKEKYEKYV